MKGHLLVPSEIRRCYLAYLWLVRRSEPQRVLTLSSNLLFRGIALLLDPKYVGDPITDDPPIQLYRA